LTRVITWSIGVDWLFLYFELTGNRTATKERPVWRGHPDALFFRTQDRLLFLELHTCKDPILIVDDNCFLECRCCRLLERLVNWIVINVVITVFDGMELQDKSVADAVLFEKVRLLTISKLRSAAYLQILSRDVLPSGDRNNVRPERSWMYACFLQPKKLRNHLRSGLSVAHQRGSCARLTSLTANLLVPSLNWNNTICVV